MSAEETSRFVRVRVDLVVEVHDPDGLTETAVGRIEDDPELPDAERGHARSAVTEDTAEALAYLVDPFDLVSGVPGVELQQASWSTEQIDYDPDSPEWGPYEDDGGDENDDDGDGAGIG
ncbi:hypothetical protein ABZ464_28630 [Streptomyces sp. NPDC005820]|uniref:hypothetical protein n=1 Tax=Streptomyces sp. NPDC005820 TaxID=3157069 RepID=UPI0033E55EDE